MEVRLKELYKKEIIKKLVTKLGRKNVLSLPRITKIVVNSGIGKFKDDKGLIEGVVKDIAAITGQKPTLRRAKQSISNFKVRENEVIGVSVTLRGDKMWMFLDKLLNVVLPRVRDFKGLSRKSFDGAGNYSLGLREHTVFPEVNPNTVDKIKSLEVTIVTSCKKDNEALELLTELGVPFSK